jgi:hypothetical protein
MRIYIGHSVGFDYQKELYEPLKASELFKQHELILPHEANPPTRNQKNFYSTLDLFVAEVSYPSTGLGIELAWAQDAGRKILCVHRADKKPSRSIGSLCTDIRIYNNMEELVKIIQSVVEI